MDIAAFADENFDEKEWINKIFRCPEAQENKDVFATSLVKKLQVYIQQVGVALEDGSQKVLQSLPRVVHDTELLNQEALALREKMQAIKAEIAKAEQDTGQSMAALEQVDRVKTQLQAARQALREADNWTLLATDIEDKFEHGDLDGAAATLESMQQSLRILAHVPDIEDKRLQLEGLKNRLEAAASPLLVQAFTAASVEQSRRFVKIFCGIERLPQLLQYHHKCQEKLLLQQLRDLAEQDENAAECLQNVYHALHRCWEEQAKWCNQVFSPTPILSVLLPLFADLLIGLEPPLSACVGSCLALQDPLASLTDLRQVTRQAATTLQSAVETLISQARLEERPDPDVVLALAQAINAPWVVAVQRYGELERPGLQSQLNSLGGEEIGDRVEVLAQASSRVAEISSLALNRCSKLTEMCGVAGLIEAMQDYVKGFTGKHRTVLEELSGLKGEQEDWSLFQMCLTMFQASGELLSQLQQAEDQVIQNLQELSSHLHLPNLSPFLQHHELLLTPEGRTALEDLMAAAQVGGEPGQVLTSSLQECRDLCLLAHKTAVDVIFGPIAAHLKAVSSAEVWASSSLSSDLPDFSFSPQEYITQVGQYLMTLPQHLEPFLLRENHGVGTALRAILPSEEKAAEEEVQHQDAAALLLGAVATSTSQNLCDLALVIEHLSASGARQLATDISYLGNVLEDLGLSLSEPLRQICLLLRAAPDTYKETSMGCSPRLVAAVRQMRGLPSTS